MATKLVRLVTYHKGLALTHNVTYVNNVTNVTNVTYFWSRDLVTLRDKLKPLYLHYHYIYGHKTWQDGDLPLVASTHKVKWPYNHLVLRDDVTN